MSFQVDFRDLLKRLLPWFMRVGRTVDYLDSPGNTLEGLNNELLEFRDEKRTLICVTAQIIHFEYYLNTILGYDFVYSGIFIQDVAEDLYVYVRNVIEAVDPEFYLYQKSEIGTTPGGLGAPLLNSMIADDETPKYLFNLSEFITDLDYIVYVPIYLTSALWTATTYTAGQYVEYDGKIYICILNAGAGDDPTDATYWQEIGLPYDEDKMKSEIDIYNLAGKRYEIQTY